MALHRAVVHRISGVFRHHEAVREFRHVSRRVRHVCGTQSYSTSADSLVVLCVVRNGSYYLEAFLDHYRVLGATRIVLLDNGSTDDTVATASRNADVTVYRSHVPFSSYIVGLKRYLVSLHKSCGWVLVADIDEFFDYPGSNSLSLGRFLAYLNRNRYTAVTVQMLDMFGSFPEAAAPSTFTPDRFPFYDLHNLDTRPAPRVVFGRRNRYANPAIPVYRGGIRMSSFHIKPWLTKHALFYAPSITAHAYGQHVVGGARIADISALFRHYLFTPHFPAKCAREAVSRTNKQGGTEYQAYLRVLQRSSPIDYLCPVETHRFSSVDRLVDEGFLHVSPAYRKWVEQHR